MKRNDFHKLLEKVDPSLEKDKNQVLESVKLRLGINQVTTKKNIINKKFAFAMIPLVLICLLIPIIAITMSLKPKEPVIRFCSEEDYVVSDSLIHLKEFSETDNKILFLNWYDEPATTLTYADKNDLSTILGIKELVINPLTGDEIKIIVSFKNIKFDFVESVIDNLSKETTIEGILVKWQYSKSKGMAYFEYNAYTYYLEFDMPSEESIIIDTVTELLSSKN